MISLNINDKYFNVEVDPDTPLLWVLRDHIKLTGAKYSCGIGVCGSCTVLVNDRPVKSCVVPVATLAGKRITTIEGVSHNEELHPVQQAWLDESVTECGYCQPAQILTAISLINSNPQPTDRQIDHAMSDVLCRCGTYLRVRKAIHRAMLNLNR